MGILTLKKQDGTDAFVDEGEFARVQWSFESVPLMEAIVKADVTTVTATLFDRKTKAIINSKLNQDILDTNGGALSDELDFQLLLSSADNVIVSPDSVGDGITEEHILRIRWQWTVAGATLNGIQDFLLFVRKLYSPIDV